MAVSNADIQAWWSQNSGASEQEIANVMQQHGVSPQQMAEATGGNVNYISERYNALTQPTASSSQTQTAYAVSGGGAPKVSAADIKAYNDNALAQGYSMQQIDADMKKYGVSIDDYLSAAYSDPAQSQAALFKYLDYTNPTAAASLREWDRGTKEWMEKGYITNADGTRFGGYDPIAQSIMDTGGKVGGVSRATSSSQATGSVSDADIKAWWNANSGAGNEAIAATMLKYGVSPEQMARAIGGDASTVSSAFYATDAYKNSTKTSEEEALRLQLEEMQRQLEELAKMKQQQQSSGVSPTNFSTNELKVAAIADKDNPLVRQAIARARQNFAGRGLLNTSMAEQSAQEAAIAKALEIAAPDTAAYYTDQRDAKQFDYQTALNQQSYAQQEYMARLNNDLGIASAQAQYDMKVGDTTHTNYLTMIDRIQQDTTKQVQQINSSAMPYTEKEAAIKNIQAQAQAQIANANQLFKSMNGWQDSWAVAADSYGWSTASLPQAA